MGFLDWIDRVLNGSTEQLPNAPWHMIFDASRVELALFAAKVTQNLPVQCAMQFEALSVFAPSDVVAHQVADLAKQSPGICVMHGGLIAPYVSDPSGRNVSSQFRR